MGLILDREVGGRGVLLRRMTCGVRCKRQSCLATWSPRLTLARVALMFSLTLLTFPASQSRGQWKPPPGLHTPSVQDKPPVDTELQIPSGGGVVVTPVPSGVAWGGDLHVQCELRQLPASKHGGCCPLGLMDPRRMPAVAPYAVSLWHLPELCLCGPGAAAGHHGNRNFVHRFSCSFSPLLPFFLLFCPYTHSLTSLYFPSSIFCSSFSTLLVISSTV